MRELFYLFFLSFVIPSYIVLQKEIGQSNLKDFGILLYILFTGALMIYLFVRCIRDFVKDPNNGH